MEANFECAKSRNSTLIIEGHCDERGTEEYNIALGERRADSVKAYFRQMGLDASRIKTVSYGEARPKAFGSGEDSWSQNRRVELIWE